LNATPDIEIAEREVHIWTERLALSPEAVAEAKAVLSKSEIARAERFHFRRDHDRYAVGHARLRQILSGYTGFQASRLEFELSEFGKPSLHPAMNGRGIDFNLSHSGDWFLLGITRNARIGVDIEEIRPESATDEVAERFFTKRENAELRTLAADERIVAFFKCWTRKEAYLKALGCGLSASPTDCDVTLLPGAQPQIRQRVAKDSDQWSLFDLSSEGYIAAVAIDGTGITIKRKSG
jgi:4'-phosphopantetheinyl transferase